MGARLGLREIVGSSTHDDFGAEVEEVPQRLLEREQFGAAVYEREQVYAESRLQRRLLVELVEYDVALRVATQFDHDAHPIAIRFVPKIGDTIDLACTYQVSDPLQERRLVDHVGDLGDNDPRSALALFEPCARANREQAAARRVGGSNAVAAADHRSGRKVWTGEFFEQFVERAIRVGGF